MREYRILAPALIAASLFSVSGGNISEEHKTWGQCAGSSGLEEEGILNPGHVFEITKETDSFGNPTYAKKDIGLDQSCFLNIDSQIFPSLEVIFQSQFRELALLLIRYKIVFADTPPGYAITYPRQRKIEISNRLKGLGKETIAASLVHEGSHIKDFEDKNLNSASDCIESEIRAYKKQGIFWNTLYSGGKNNANSEFEKELNGIAYDALTMPIEFEDVVRKTYAGICGPA